MAFCVTTDILTNISMATTDVPTALLAKAIIKADAEIRAAFSTDLLAALDALEVTPAIVKSLSEDISSYYVMRGLYAGNTPSINAWIDRYKDAKEMLKEIAAGTKKIEEVDVEIGGVKSSTKDYKRTFSEQDETNWAIDSNKLEDLAND